MTTVPRFENLLPEFRQFAMGLAADCKAGTIDGWPVFQDRVRAFFTPEMMAKVEPAVPGWGQMATHANQQTLIHVTSVLVALYLLPEYQKATPDQQALMEWMVLYHDVTKVARRDKHDYVHAFRSAAEAGKGLVADGFPVTDAYAEWINRWYVRTMNAVIFHEDIKEYIQDNRQLPEIVAGIDRLFGVRAAAGYVIKAVLLHLSIATDPDYPIVAPLTEDEIKRYLDPGTFAMLKVMMLADANGWNLFDADTKQCYRQQTLAVFNQIKALIANK